MKRIIKIFLLVILFAVKVFMEQPEDSRNSAEINHNFQDRETVQVIGDTGNFHLELKWNSEKLSIKSIVPSKIKLKAIHA